MALRYAYVTCSQVSCMMFARNHIRICIVISDKSQGSVATHFRGDEFGDQFRANSSFSSSAKEFGTLVAIWRSCRQDYSVC